MRLPCWPQPFWWHSTFYWLFCLILPGSDFRAPQRCPQGFVPNCNCLFWAQHHPVTTSRVFFFMSLTLRLSTPKLIHRLFAPSVLWAHSGVPHQQHCIWSHLMLFFSPGGGIAEYLEEQECLTPNRNIIQCDDLQQRKMENMFTIFYFTTLQLTQTFLKSFCHVPCTARQSCRHPWGWIQRRKCAKITDRRFKVQMDGV